MAKQKQLSLEIQQSILVLGKTCYSVQELANKLRILIMEIKMYTIVFRYMLQLDPIQDRRRSRRPKCTCAQEEINQRVRCFTAPELPASLKKQERNQSAQTLYTGDSD